MASKNTTGYEVDYNDKRFKAINKEEKTTIKDSDKLYDGMIDQTDSYFEAQTDAVNQWGETQKQLQQEQTDFTIEQIKQQKAEAEQSFQKEGSAAYADWQKQKDDYGTNAEKMAQSGLAASGYSESSQVAMYTAYQQRVAAARQSYEKAVQGYNNAMTEARLQNSSAMAEIAYNTLLQSLQLSLQGFQYKNDLLLQKTQAKRQLSDTYYGRRMDLVNQINNEKSTAEQIRQYNASLKEEQRQFNESLAWQKQKEYG